MYTSLLLLSSLTPHQISLNPWISVLLHGNCGGNDLDRITGTGGPIVHTSSQHNICLRFFKVILFYNGPLVFSLFCTSVGFFFLFQVSGRKRKWGGGWQNFHMLHQMITQSYVCCVRMLKDFTFWTKTTQLSFLQWWKYSVSLLGLSTSFTRLLKVWMRPI